MVEVIFKFNNTDIKIKEDIFNKFSSIINKPFDELYFNYNKNSVNYKITLDELIEEEDNINNIEILVYTKEKNEMINEIYEELKQKYNYWFYEDSHRTIKYDIIKRVINTDKNKEVIIKEIEEEKEKIELIYNELEEEYGISF